MQLLHDMRVLGNQIGERFFVLREIPRDDLQLPHRVDAVMMVRIDKVRLRQLVRRDPSPDRGERAA